MLMYSFANEPMDINNSEAEEIGETFTILTACFGSRDRPPDLQCFASKEKKKGDNNV